MIREELSSEMKAIPEEQGNSLKGDTPYDVIVESIIDQFDEFYQDGFITSDKENYLDKMDLAIKLSQRINQAAIDEFEVDDGTVSWMKNHWNDLILELMSAIGVDLSQMDDPYYVAYFLYTNFMITSQRQAFFNYFVKSTVRASVMESELAIAEGRMLENKPDDMYNRIFHMFDGKTEIKSVYGFLRDKGFSEILGWIQDGFIPEQILFDVFLKPMNSLPYMFVSYWQYRMDEESSLDR